MKGLSIAAPYKFVLSIAVLCTSALSIAALCMPVLCFAQIKDIHVNSTSELTRLLSEVDRDHDKRITLDDLKQPGAKTKFELQDKSGQKFEVAGVYYLSNLLLELKYSEKSNSVQGALVYENPVHRVSRLIRDVFWDGLTRRIDGDSLGKVLDDPKIPKAPKRYLYVPKSDEASLKYFLNLEKSKPDLHFEVIPWAPGDPLTVRTRPGLLALKLGAPYVVPGGRFNEMYGWDSYFECLGLLADGRLDLCRSMIENFVFEIENYGKILNANRSYYLNRSQPPFLTSMISAYWAASKKSKSRPSKAWLKQAVRAAIREYETVWMNSDHLTTMGLSRYFARAYGIPPEVEPGHFDPILKPAAKRLGLSLKALEKGLNSGEIKDQALEDFFNQDLAVRESGHDTTYRWTVEGVDRAADFVTVDLNSLLFKYELDLARLLTQNFKGQIDQSHASEWLARAKRRKALMQKYLWDPKRQIFVDYNFKTKTLSQYVSATSFYPLWAQDPSLPKLRLETPVQARTSVGFLLKALEAPGGVTATSLESLHKYGQPQNPRQWEYPNGWAPHQMILWAGLANYGFTHDADRLIYKWLYTITKAAADYNGTVPEKFDVVRRSHAVFDEYGNVGTEFSYITREGFGWMNASYQVGLKSLSPKWRKPLEDLVPPEWQSFSE